MDYIRWLVRKIDLDTPFTPVAFILSFFALFVSSAISHILGAIVAIILACVYGTVLYVVISDAFRKSYAKYLEEKNKP